MEQPQAHPKKQSTSKLSLPFDNEFTEQQQKEYFSDRELVELNSINKLKSNDRAYGRKLFECLYRGNLSTLHTRTLSATSKTGKQPITPKKLNLLKNMMTILGKKSNDQIDQLERTAPAYMGGILSDALYAVKNMHTIDPDK